MEAILTDNPSFDRLCQALTTIKNGEEAAAFLRDLCTVSEIVAMTERLEVARQIQEGRSYRKINEETGMSTATITRVAHWLHHGTGGYGLMLERI